MSKRKAETVDDETLKRAKKSNILNECLCPITREIMFSPVLACDGFIYEKKVIDTID